VANTVYSSTKTDPLMRHFPFLKKGHIQCMPSTFTMIFHDSMLVL
jgi:hypothetical protein